MEDIIKFISLVEDMRTLQKAYFKEKDNERKEFLLTEAKIKEREVDAQIIKLESEGFEL